MCANTDEYIPILMPGETAARGVPRHKNKAEISGASLKLLHGLRTAYHARSDEQRLPRSTLCEPSSSGGPFEG